MSILVLGYYYRYNTGDDAFGTVFKAILGDKAIIKNTDDIESIPNNIQLVICGGGDIINPYFMNKIIRLTKNKKVPIIAVSIGIPFESAFNSKEFNIFDFVFVRNKTDLPRLVKRFSYEYARYYPDLTFLLPSIVPYVKSYYIDPNYFNIGLFLVRNIHAKNYNYKKIVSQLILLCESLLKLTIKGKEVRILLIPFGTSHHSDRENDIILNTDLKTQIMDSRLINIDKRLEVEETFNIIKNLDAGICMRLHSHIFCFMNNVPIVSIAFTRKVKNFMVENEMSDLVYEPKLDQQHYFPIECEPQTVLEKFNYLVTNYDQIKNKMISKNTVHFEQISEFRDNLLKMIKDGVNKRSGIPLYISDEQIIIETEKIIRLLIRYLFQYLAPDIGQKEEEYCALLKNNINLKVVIDLILSKSVQEIKWQKIQVDMASIICLYITGLVKPIYYYGLLEQIFTPEYNLKESIKWLYNDMCCQTDYGRSLGYASNYQKKLDVGYISQDDFRSVHRSGWSFVIHNLEGLHCQEIDPEKVKQIAVLDTYLDRTFHWGEEAFHLTGKIPFTRSWIGFIHHTFDRTFSCYNVPNMLKKQSFVQSLPYCRGLFVLSQDLNNKLKVALTEIGFDQIPINTIIHPTDLSCPRFSLDKFIQNQDRKLVQIGGWLRQTFAIYRVNIINNSLQIRKVALKGKEMNQYYPPINFKEELEQCAKKFGNNKFAESLFFDIREIMNNVEIIDRLNNEDYDELLSQNLVFINLIDASAVNTVVECIVRETPILVNKLPAVIEVLGPDYPLYYDKMHEIEPLLKIDKIKEAYEYLKNIDKEQFSMGRFMDNFVNSEIYSSL